MSIHPSGLVTTGNAGGDSIGTCKDNLGTDGSRQTNANQLSTVGAQRLVAAAALTDAGREVLDLVVDLTLLG